MSRPNTVRIVALTLLLGLPAMLLAQEPTDDAEVTGEAEATGEADPTAMPTHTGGGSVTEAVDSDRGAIFDIGGGITMLLPRGLPIGHSRLLTLRKDNKAPKPADVASGFQRHGQTVRFDGALNASNSPIELALAMKKAPEKRGFRFVLAMEVAGLCDDSNRHNRISQLLCSTWEIVDASYEDGRAVAHLGRTGGYRLQFGWIPVSAE